MPEIGYASMAVIPTFKGLQGDLERGSSKALAAAGVTGGDQFGRSATKAARGRFAGAAKGIVAPLVGALAAVKIGDFFKDSVAEARESQKVTALTNRVIKTTGGVAKVSAKHVGNLATQISNKTAIDDEAIQSGANLLLTFKNVRNEVGKGNKIFDQATQAAVDLSAAGFGDLSGTSKQLGKALNDPVKGITALGRAGVTFTDQQKKQIKSFVASGDALKAQKMILREVTSQVGGAAQSQATSGEKVRVAFDNIKESVGTALLPAIEDVEQAFLHKGIPAIQKFVTWAQDKAVPALKDFGKKATPVVRDVLGKAKDFLKEAQPYAEGFVTAFNKLPDGVKKGIGAAALLGFGASKIPGVKAGAGAAASATKGIFGLVSKAKPLPVYVVNEGFGGGKGLPGVPGKGKTPAGLGKDAKFLTGLGPYGFLAAGTVAGGIAANKYGPRAAPVGPPTSGKIDTQKPALVAPLAKAVASLSTEPLKRAAFYTGVARQNLEKLPNEYERGKNGAQALASEVFGVERSTKRTHTAVINLVTELEKARRKAAVVDQAVSAARTSKVDRQLGGGMYVANMNVHGTSLNEVRRDAQHQHRSRAYGAESFK